MTVKFTDKKLLTREETRERLLSPEDLSAWIGISQTTLSIWRCRKRGPAFLKLAGGRIRYVKSDVEKWMASMRTVPHARRKSA